MKKIIYVLAFVMASAAAYSGTSNTSIVSGGLWSATATWNLGTVPSSSDNVVIATNVILDCDAQVLSLLVNNSCTLSDDGSPHTITFSGDGSITNSGIWTATKASLSFSGNGTLASSNAYSIKNLTLYGALTVVTSPTVIEAVEIYGTLILEEDLSVKSLIVYASGTLSDDDNWLAITISDGGSIANNGTWNATNTSLYFLGSGTLASSSNPYSIQDLTLYGVLNVVTSPSVEGVVYLEDAVTVTGNDIVYGTSGGIEFGADHTVSSGDHLWSSATVLGSAGVTIDSDKELTINEARSCLGGISNSGTLTLGAAIEIGSQFSCGTFNHNNHTVTIKGDKDCSVSGSISFYDLIINTTTATRTVQFDGSISVLHSFTFTSGRAKIVNNARLDLGSAALYGNSSSQFFISAGGSLVRTVSESATVEFPVGGQNGDAGAIYYNPVIFTNKGGAGKYGVACVYGGTFPKAVNTKWTIANIDATSPNIDVVLQWSASEEAAPFTHDADNIYVGKKTSVPVWSQAKAAVSGSGPYTVPLSGIIVFGDFYIGNSGAFPTVAPSAGHGTSGSPYQITNFTDLCWIAFEPTHWSLYYVQTADIDASATSAWYSDGSGGYYGWQPIGSNDTKFTGSYDGQSHMISNVYMNRPSLSYAGFMGYVEGATISNLGIANCNISAGYSVGCLAGDVENSSTSSEISNCFATGIISGTENVGGLIGNMNTSILSSSYSRANVSGSGSSPSKIGGLIGTHYGTINNCYSAGSVTAPSGQFVGGLIGFSNGMAVKINKCYSTGSVSGGTQVGGLVGYVGASTPDISNCFWDKTTSGLETSAGGTGKTTGEMTTQTTFTDAGWDFTSGTPIWEMIPTNYPRLKANPDGALPVELTSFTAVVEKGNVVLNWNTATEVNNAGFQIEKLQAKSEKWESIGFVDGHGTTNAPQSYSYSDKPGSGKYQYRLKQIDRDGKFEYSQTIEATVELPVQFGLSQNYPNPFNPSTVIQYSIASQSNVVLKVYDVLGKEVVTLVNETKQPGSYSAVFNASMLANGVYFYKLDAGQFSDVKRLTLLK